MAGNDICFGVICKPRHTRMEHNKVPRVQSTLERHHSTCRWHKQANDNTCQTQDRQSKRLTFVGQLVDLWESFATMQ
eukprot:6339744-Amphidinium_carterae.1